MTERALAALVLPALVLVLAAAAGAAPAGPGTPPALRRVCIRGTCFAAELAVTEAERSRGLMFRERLAPDRGMLFVFPDEGPYGFWMKNTRIELDIVFIGADRRIVSIARRARPCVADPCPVYEPAASAAYALEIGGGLADRHGFAPGDLVEFR